MQGVPNPPHPGKILKQEILDALGIPVTDAAHQLGVSRSQLSRFINGHAGVSADLAIRLSHWVGGSAHTWLRMQANYDLWHAEHSFCPAPKIMPLASIGSLQIPGLPQH